MELQGGAEMGEKEYIDKMFNVDDFEKIQEEIEGGLLDNLIEEVPKNLHEGIMKKIDKHKKRFNFKIYGPIAAAACIIIAISFQNKIFIKSTKMESKDETKSERKLASSESTPEEKNTTNVYDNGIKTQDTNVKEAPSTKSPKNMDNVEKSELSGFEFNESNKDKNQVETRSSTKLNEDKSQVETRSLAKSKDDKNQVEARSVAKSNNIVYNFEIKLSNEKNKDIIEFIEKNGEKLDENFYKLSVDNFNILDGMLKKQGIEKITSYENIEKEVIIKINLKE